jgi:hypothetical protein
MSFDRSPLAWRMVRKSDDVWAGVGYAGPSGSPPTLAGPAQGSMFAITCLMRV